MRILFRCSLTSVPEKKGRNLEETDLTVSEENV